MTQRARKPTKDLLETHLNVASELSRPVMMAL
jgi:hypothetical protein